ncbi:hypothetical protein HPB50_003130 [Hyalomma asiaticum]|uniref:Uncharacterized protein n=1 Tax=Hyalomma asiaticum TaxID=266040 RepID=A0ACB7SKF5_HYAAI|nr:hypothetical protein HPB50_003130 [Hyalomma asiaticum]
MKEQVSRGGGPKRGSSGAACWSRDQRKPRCRRRHHEARSPTIGWDTGHRAPVLWAPAGPGPNGSAALMVSAERRPKPRRRWLMARRPLLFLPLLQLLAAVAPAACLTVNTEPSEALPAMRSRQADTRVLLELEEGQPAGTLVGYIPVRANFTYRFNEQPAEFTLDPESGAIRTAVEIDREQLASDRFDLVVLSSQPTYPIEVRLRVLDVNDNAPEFPESSLNVAFSESANVGTRVILDTASDGDAGANGLSTDYRIVGGNEDAKFRLVVTTNPSGETPFLHLETTGRLDREARDSYTLNVSARDGGTPPRLGHLQVNVTVLDVNDNPPMFDHSDYFVSINESLPAGASVLQVRATDADAGVNAQLSYFLDPSVQADFAIDADTGVLRTASTGPPRCKRSRPDAPRSCVFTVFAHDHGSPRQDGRAYVTVSLVDANDHEPVIRFRVFTAPDSYATVDENAQNGSVVAAVSVIDHDEGPNGDTVVEIRGGNELGHFRLEPTPSFDIVRVNGILDREKVSRYNLTVVATDRGSPPRSSTAFLLILVNDVNDHEPVFEQSEYSSQLSELAPIGSFVAAVTATDRDTGINARLSYAISSGNEKLWFRIDPATGLVTTTRPIDREQQDLIELKISAKDGGPNPRWAHAILRVQLLDENDQAPAFALNSFKASIPENAEPGSLVTVLSAADGDLGSNGSVAYSLAPEVELMYPGMFHLDEVHGRLIAKQSLDRERQDAYSVIVVARDQGNPAQSSTATVELSVLDVDDHRPQFYPTQYFVELADGAPPGSFVSTVTATDQDDGNNARVAYSILAGAQGKFCIDATSGTLETTQELRLEHQARYEIQGCHGSAARANPRALAATGPEAGDRSRAPANPRVAAAHGLLTSGGRRNNGRYLARRQQADLPLGPPVANAMHDTGAQPEHVPDVPDRYRAPPALIGSERPLHWPCPRNVVKIKKRAAGRHSHLPSSRPPSRGTSFGGLPPHRIFLPAAGSAGRLLRDFDGPSPVGAARSRYPRRRDMVHRLSSRDTSSNAVRRRGRAPTLLR